MLGAEECEKPSLYQRHKGSRYAWQVRGRTATAMVDNIPCAIDLDGVDHQTHAGAVVVFADRAADGEIRYRQIDHPCDIPGRAVAVLSKCLCRKAGILPDGNTGEVARRGGGDIHD